MRRNLALVGVAMTFLLSQVPASAGGWWTYLNFHNRYIGIGESLTIKIHEVHYDSIEEAQRAKNVDHFAYLVSDFDRRSMRKAMSRPDPKDWWEPFGQIIQVGTVTLSDSDSNLTRGLVNLKVPEVAAGRYFLMLCDADCRTPLANHIPVSVNVTEDVLAARTARRLKDSNQRLELGLARTRAEVRQAQRRLQRSEIQTDRMRNEVTALQSEPGNEDSDGTTSWLAYLGLFMAGAAVAYSLTRLQSRSAPPADPVLSQGGHR